MDVMVHIDPEDDMQDKSNAHLPGRPGLMAHLAELLEDSGLAGNRVVFHYLDGKVDVEIYLSTGQAQEKHADDLQARCNEIANDDQLFRAIHIHRSHAQN